MEKLSSEIVGQDLSKLPCCGIYAVATFCGQSFDKVWSAYSKAHKKGPRWKGRTRSDYLFKMAEKMAPRKTTQVTLQRDQKITLMKFVEWHTKPTASYLLWLSGHFVTYRDGVIIDQHRVCAVEDYPRRKFVKGYMEMEAN